MDEKQFVINIVDASEHELFCLHGFWVDENDRLSRLNSKLLKSTFCEYKKLKKRYMHFGNLCKKRVRQFPTAITVLGFESHTKKKRERVQRL